MFGVRSWGPLTAAFAVQIWPCVVALCPFSGLQPQPPLISHYSSVRKTLDASRQFWSRFKPLSAYRTPMSHRGDLPSQRAALLSSLPPDGWGMKTEESLVPLESSYASMKDEGRHVIPQQDKQQLLNPIQQLFDQASTMIMPANVSPSAAAQTMPSRAADIHVRGNVEDSSTQPVDASQSGSIGEAGVASFDMDIQPPRTGAVEFMGLMRNETESALLEVDAEREWLEVASSPPKTSETQSLTTESQPSRVSVVMLQMLAIIAVCLAGYIALPYLRDNFQVQNALKAHAIVQPPAGDADKSVAESLSSAYCSTSVVVPPKLDSIQGMAVPPADDSKPRCIGTDIPPNSSPVALGDGADMLQVEAKVVTEVMSSHGGVEDIQDLDSEAVSTCVVVDAQITPDIQSPLSDENEATDFLAEMTFSDLPSIKEMEEIVLPVSKFPDVRVIKDVQVVNLLPKLSVSDVTIVEEVANPSTTDIPAGVSALSKEAFGEEEDAMRNAKGERVAALILDGAVVCYASYIVRRSLLTFSITKLAVAKFHQRRGLGRIMMRHLVQTAKHRTRGQTPLVVVCLSALPTSVNFYKACGFHPDTAVKVKDSSEYVEGQVYMEYRLQRKRTK